LQCLERAAWEAKKRVKEKHLRRVCSTIDFSRKCIAMTTAPGERHQRSEGLWASSHWDWGRNPDTHPVTLSVFLQVNCSQSNVHQLLSRAPSFLQGFNQMRDRVDLDSRSAGKDHQESCLDELKALSIYRVYIHNIWPTHLSLRLLSKNKFGGTAEEIRRTWAGWAAAETPGGLSDTEAEGGRAEGRRLWEDMWAGGRQRRSRLQGLPQTLWSDHGEEGELWPSRFGVGGA